MTDGDVTMSRLMGHEEPAINPHDASVADPVVVAAAEEETVDGLPVLAEVRTLERPMPAGLPAVQAAAAMATGFVCGAATIALVKRHSGRKLARAARNNPRRGADVLPIVASRTFLVDIHLIAKPEE